MNSTTELLVKKETAKAQLLRDVQELVRTIQSDLSDARELERFVRMDLGRIAADVSRIHGAQIAVKDLELEIAELRRRA